MKTLADLETFVDLVLSPGFDLDAAQRRVGPITRWFGGRALCKSADPALQRVVLETLDGALMGVQAGLTTSVDVSWTDLRAKLGEGQERGMASDHWGGPIPYEFSRKAPHPPGTLLLDVAAGGGPTARIQAMIVRRPVKK
jgi:hypothetical protein